MLYVLLPMRELCNTDTGGSFQVKQPERYSDNHGCGGVLGVFPYSSFIFLYENDIVPITRWEVSVKKIVGFFIKTIIRYLTNRIFLLHKCYTAATQYYTVLHSDPHGYRVLHSTTQVLHSVTQVLHSATKGLHSATQVLDCFTQCYTVIHTQYRVLHKCYIVLHKCYTVLHSAT